jgi:cytochrome c553
MHLTSRIAAGLLGLGLAAGLTVQADAAGNAAAGKNKSMVCQACHGADGNGGADPLWPRLAGQNPDYIAKQLKDFKSGARKDPIMIGMVAALSDADMQDLGAFFGSLKPKAGAVKDAALAKQGEKLFRGGNAANGIAACMSCHGPTGSGVPPRFPRVAGQNQPYTTKQLLAFKSGARTNDAETMTRVVFKMTDQELKAASEFMASLH